MRQRPKHFARHAADDLAETVVEDRPVIDGRPCALAQPDEHHLHQPAFDVADKLGVRLDAAADHHVVGLIGEAVEVDGEAFGRLADDDRFHAGADRAAHERLGDAVALDDPPLAFGRAAAVAAHGRHHERLGPQLLEVFDGRPDDRGDIGDAAAAGGDRHALARLDLLAQSQAAQLGVDLGRHVVDSGDPKRLS